MWPKFLKGNRRRRQQLDQDDLFGDAFHTPTQSLANLGPSAEEIEAQQALANQLELAKNLPWLGSVVFGMLIVLALVGWWLAFISTAVADSGCSEIDKACGSFFRFGQAYFSLVFQIVCLLVLIALVLTRTISAYRELATSIYSIILINSLMLTASMGLAAAQGGAQSGAVRSMQIGFTILDILNVMVLFMVSITPNGKLRLLSLDSIPLPWSNRASKKKKKKAVV